MSESSNGWQTWQLMGIAIVLLVLVMYYYYNECEKLKKEIAKGCENYSDPELSATRDMIMSKMKVDIKAMLSKEIKDNYPKILSATGKLKEYQKNKIIKKVEESASHVVDLEVDDMF